MPRMSATLVTGIDPAEASVAASTTNAAPATPAAPFDVSSKIRRSVICWPISREWHGSTHIVLVTDTGFDYAGANYKSLTQIAKLITGAHWSGPRFFGLTTRRHTQERANG